VWRTTGHAARLERIVTVVDGRRLTGNDHVCGPNNLVGEELWRLVRHIDANLGHNSNHGPIDLLRRVRSAERPATPPAA